VATGKKLLDLEGGSAGTVSFLAFSPHGKELALGTSGFDGVIRLYDPATGKMNRTIRGHDRPPIAAVYSKDGKLLASGGQDKTARVWDATTGQELHCFRESDVLVDVALSPDGTMLATKTPESVGLWDVGSGKAVRRIQTRIHNLRSLAFTPDGKVLTSDDKLWDAATGQVICECAVEIKGEVAFSPDGKTLAGCGADGRVHLFDPATGKELPASRAGWNNGMQNPAVFTPDGKQLVVCCKQDDGGVYLCETATGRKIREFAPHDYQPYLVALAPDGKTLVTGHNPKTFSLWETATGKQLYEVEGPWKRSSWSAAFAFAPDGRTFATALAENVVRLKDTATGKELQQFHGLDDDSYSLFFRADGKTLVSMSQKKAISWNVADGKQRNAPLKLTEGIQAFSPDGRIVAVYNSRSKDTALHLQETATGKEIQRITDNFLWHCAFSPDGKTLAVYASGEYAPNKERAVLLLEVATGQMRMKLPGHPAGDLGQMVFSPDGRMLAAGGSDMTTLVWDATGRMVEGKLKTAALSPKELRDSRAALAGDDAAQAYRAIWSLTAAPEQTLPLLKEHLRPLPGADPKETARRIADLDNDHFDVREKAQKELGEQGELVESALRKTLDERPSLEVRRRIEQLLEKLNTPRTLQEYRAIEVLERIGTSEAEKVLKEVAQGAPAARLTQEAKASLDRLSRKPAP
jgi:WD40 repeat protein